MAGLISIGRAFLKAAQPREALATLRHAFVLYGGSPALDRWLGVAAQQCEEDELAIAAYERVLVEKPDDIEVVVNLAEIYLSQVAIERAAKLLGRAMELDPSAMHPSGVRARVLIMKAKKQFS